MLYTAGTHTPRGSAWGGAQDPGQRRGSGQGKETPTRGGDPGRSHPEPDGSRQQEFEPGVPEDPDFRAKDNGASTNQWSGPLFGATRAPLDPIRIHWPFATSKGSRQVDAIPSGLHLPKADPGSMDQARPKPNPKQGLGSHGRLAQLPQVPHGRLPPAPMESAAYPPLRPAANIPPVFHHARLATLLD